MVQYTEVVVGTQNGHKSDLLYPSFHDINLNIFFKMNWQKLTMEHIQSSLGK